MLRPVLHSPLMPPVLTRSPDFILPDYHRIRRVHSFDELVNTRFENGVNALCWPRTLPGNFAEVVAGLSPLLGSGITTLDDETLLALNLSAAGAAAREVLLQDQHLLRQHELDPVLDYVLGYPHESESCYLPTHVQSFHADSATVPADTYLCTYHGSCSEGLANEEAICHVDIPATRAELLRQSGGADGEDFEQYLTEHFYNLHYAALPDARPYAFGQGHLWRIAIQYPGCPVPPCIHRAPATIPGQPRLLLIS